MLRFIVRTTDSGAACHVGGPVHTSHNTLDYDLPALETFLTQTGDYENREVIGVEIILTSPPSEPT
jgi:hypothetical protein